MIDGELFDPTRHIVLDELSHPRLHRLCRSVSQLKNRGCFSVLLEVTNPNTQQVEYVLVMSDYASVFCKLDQIEVVNEEIKH